MQLTEERKREIAFLLLEYLFMHYGVTHLFGPGFMSAAKEMNITNDEMVAFVTPYTDKYPH